MCALVTGVQTCDLPIRVGGQLKGASGEAVELIVHRNILLSGSEIIAQPAQRRADELAVEPVPVESVDRGRRGASQAAPQPPRIRSEERRLGKECVSTCRSRGAA